MTTVTRPLRFEFQSRRKRATTSPLARDCENESDSHPTLRLTGHVPRVAKLMALAIKFDGLLRDGVVSSQSELAALCRITQPRATQILNLLRLAPDLQETVLFLRCDPDGREPIHEHMLREVVAIDNWNRQRTAWASIVKNLAP